MHRSIITYCLALLAACGENDSPEAPTLGSVTFTTAEDTPVTVTLRVTAVERGAITFTAVTPPDHGTLTGTARRRSRSTTRRPRTARSTPGSTAGSR